MAGKGSVDLDAILEDAIKSENLADKPPAPPAPATSGKPKLVSDEIKPWLAFTANVPKETREKWTKMAKVDIETELVSKFQPSYAYRAWDGPTPVKNGINRSLQEIVKRAAIKAGLDENKLGRLLNLVNPVTDGENGKQLQAAFAKQLIKDYSQDIKNDPNYDASKLTALASVLH
jgi:hypothetical protein